MQKTATQVTVLYRPADLIALAEVQIGERYTLPTGVFEFFGTMAEFLAANPDYTQA